MRQILFIVLTFLTFHLHAADYYWVGGGGNWNDLNHWRLGSSGGPIPSIVPSFADNVFFEANSGFGTTVASRTVTLNSNGFCNNMTWMSVPNNPIFQRQASTTFIVEVWGNLLFSPTTTYSVPFSFRGTTSNTLTTNGNVIGSCGIDINKNGGTVTVADSLIQSNVVGITLTSGTFDIASKKVVAYSFTSNNSNVRTLEMTNAKIIMGTGTFDYRGINKTLNAAGSYVESYFLYTDGGVYNKVVCNGGTGGNQLHISSTTFSSLIFSNVFSTVAFLSNSNTVLDTLTFMGTGEIAYSNTIGYLYFNKRGNINGSNNTFHKIECADQLILPAGFTLTNVNTVDSLLLAPNRLASLDGTLNINNYFHVDGTPCEAFTQINGDSTNGVINFASGAVVDISNVLLTGIKATGPVIPIAVNGVDGGGNTGFTITEPSIAGTTLYWVGGPGDWNDRSHWSTTSGGADSACIPFRNDDVVFDANSGLGSGTVTTSSASFCHNMTWNGIGNVTFNESGTSSFKIYGSLVMDNSVTMNAVLEFAGTESASITTNSTTTGTLQFIIAKSGSGVMTLTDDWNNAANGSIVHRSGGLNMSSRTVTLAYYSSNINAARSVDISNAVLNFTQYWDYRGTGKSLNSVGSYITSNGGFNVNGLTYNTVDVTSAIETPGNGSFFITGTTFGQLTFTNTSATSEANIDGNNIINRLELKGRGVITGGGSGNNIDTLILAGSRNYTFSGANTINNYLKAQAAPCSGLTEMRGTGSITFTSGAIVDIANVYMENMTATGPITPIAFNGADAGGNSGWTINVVPGSPRYWVGGSGDWGDPAHWSATSGGAGGTACVPTVYDDVYFNAGSGFTAASRTVTINNGNAYSHNISWAGAANNPIFNKANGLRWEVWGDSVVLNAATTLNTSTTTPNITEYLTIKGNDTTFMAGNAPAGNFDIAIEKAGSGMLTLLNNYNNTGTTFLVTTGAFNASERTLNVASIDNNDLANATKIDISNASITTGYWRYSGTPTNHVLNAANSSITTVEFLNDGKQYNKVSISGITENNVLIRTTTIDSLVFTDPSSASLVDIANNNTINYLEFIGSGRITGTGNTINTLVFSPGKIYTLTNGTNTTITGDWFANGTPCNLTEIVSSSTTANATVTKTSGDVDFDYVRIRRITAAGAAAPFTARQHSIDQGNNTNWNIMPYDGATPIYGLGADTAILATSFPYVLHTDGFFGSPSSQYTWNNSSTADSLVITDTGTYSVTVNFVDGCTVSDNIVITLAQPLPVSLVRFTADAQKCQTYLTWEITDAVRFSHFIVEHSSDGRYFAGIANVPYYTGIDQYAYVDKEVNKGASFYRLKLVDVDGKYEYSNIASVVQSDCDNGTVEVYPTLTKGTVYINIPSGYEQAKIEVYNNLGQLLELPNSGKVNGAGLHGLQLNGLARGQYFIKVIQGSKAQGFKVIYQP